METFNHRFYKKSYLSHGISAKGVHWHSKETQYIRFEIISSYIKDFPNSSIIDVGCGFGEYIKFLNEKNITYKEYLGIDCEEFILLEAKKRFRENLFINCDILKDSIPKGDYLICSGALNILKKDDFYKAIERCFNSSKKGFIFNFLTKNSFHKLKDTQVLQFCENLSTKINFSNNYLTNDMTIYLKK